MKSAVLNKLNYQTINTLKMKNKTSILARFKAFFILLVSGWRLVDVYGNPKHTHDSNGTSIDYLITSGDGSIIDVGNYFKGGENNWLVSGINPRSYPEYRKVRMWKPLTKCKRWSFYACR